MKTLFKTTRKYYKTSTDINATVVGNPTINNGVISGFSGTNYCVLPELFSPGSLPWLAQFKFTTGDNITTLNCICEQLYTNSKYQGLTIYIESGTLRFRGGNGSSNIINTNSSYTVSSNSTYYIQVEFTEDSYILRAGTDEVNWTVLATISSTSPLTSGLDLYVGRRNYGTNYYPMQGSIDLTESFIQVGGKLWWNGTLYEQCTETDNPTLYKDDTKSIANSNTERKYYKFGQYEELDLNDITIDNGWITDSSGSINSYSFFQGKRYYPGSTTRPLPTFTLQVPGMKVMSISAMSISIEAKGAGVNKYDIYKNEEFVQRVAFSGSPSDSSALNRTVTLDNPIELRPGDILKIVCISYVTAGSSTNWTSFSFKLTAETRDILEGTISDCDYYTDITLFKTVKQRKYYKYAFENKSIPIYSSATEALIGIDGVAVLDNTSMYKIFGQSTFSNRYGFKSSTVSVSLDLGGLSKLVDFAFDRYEGNAVAWPSGLKSIEASTDNVNFDTLFTGSYKTKTIAQDYDTGDTLYRFLRLTFQHHPSEIGQTNSGISYFCTNFQRRYGALSDINDYDYYIDI